MIIILPVVVIPTYPSRGGLIETFHIRAQCGVRGATEVTGNLLIVKTSDCNEKKDGSVLDFGTCFYKLFFD